MFTRRVYSTFSLPTALPSPSLRADMLPVLTIGWDNVKNEGPTILLIVLVLVIASAVFRAVFPRVARAAILRGASTPDEEMHKRASTIIHVVERTAGVA